MLLDVCIVVINYNKHFLFEESRDADAGLFFEVKNELVNEFEVYFNKEFREYCDKRFSNFELIRIF